MKETEVHCHVISPEVLPCHAVNGTGKPPRNLWRINRILTCHWQLSFLSKTRCNRPQFVNHLIQSDHKVSRSLWTAPPIKTLTGGVFDNLEIIELSQARLKLVATFPKQPEVTRWRLFAVSCVLLKRKVETYRLSYWLKRAAFEYLYNNRS